MQDKENNFIRRIKSKKYHNKIKFNIMYAFNDITEELSINIEEDIPDKKKSINIITVDIKKK